MISTAELIESLFAPEIVAPLERREIAATGERRLMLAVLESAIRAALDPARSVKAATDRNRARAWILAKGSPIGYGGITFDLCCIVNEMNPDWLRRGICLSKLWLAGERATERVSLNRQHGLTKRAKTVERERSRRSAEA